MTIQIMVDARRRYLEEFRRKASSGQRFHIEPALRTKGGALAIEGELQLPVRLDLINKSDGSRVVVSTPTPRPVVRASREVGGVSILIESPVWDALSIRLCSCAPSDFAALRRWFQTWFDEEDKNNLTDEGCYGVVHFLSDPKQVGDDTLLVADLGSAPISAFEQLLDTLAGFQTRRIEIAAS